jgi:serine/threonine protein kinase
MTELTRLGKYELRHELGKGAMGVVYEGFDPFIERTVAIKTVLKSSLDDSRSHGLLSRFRREAQAAGRLSHPNIVSIYDYGDDQDVAFIVMEFVQGKELKKYFDSEERFALPEVLRIMSQLLEALEYSHQHGVVHRDIKPANIIIAKNGMVKVADFGIAKIESSHMTQIGSVLGTPTHMSPEQFMGQAVDLRTDIYSSGVILYQFLTGERPFAGSVVTIMHKAINRDPVPPSQLNADIPAAMDNIVKKAMAKRADDRYQTAREFLTDLKLAVDGLPIDVSEIAPVATSIPTNTINPDTTMDSTDESIADAASLNARQKMDAEQAARDLVVAEASAKIAAEARRQKEQDELAARDALTAKVDPKIEADLRRKRKEAEKLWRMQDAAKAKTRINAEMKARANVGGKNKVDLDQTIIMPSATNLRNTLVSNNKFRSKLMAGGAVLLGLLLGTWFAMHTSSDPAPVVAGPEKPASQHLVPVVNK